MMMTTTTVPVPKAMMAMDEYPVPLGCAHRHLSSSSLMMACESSPPIVKKGSKKKNHRRAGSVGSAFNLPLPYIPFVPPTTNQKHLRTHTMLDSLISFGGPISPLREDGYETAVPVTREKAGIARYHDSSMAELTDDATEATAELSFYSFRCRSLSEPAFLSRRPKEDDERKQQHSVNPLYIILDTAKENVSQIHRTLTARQRISNTLRTLQAAHLLKGELDESTSNAHDDDETCDAQRLYELVGGDVGSALFLPLDVRVLHRMMEDARRTDQSKKTLRFNDSLVIFMDDDDDVHGNQTEAEYSDKKEANTKEDEFAVEILPEPQDMLQSNPRLLTQSMFQQLIDEGVPECLHMNKWKRIFSIGRDGDAFLTMLECCANYQYTILAIKTTTGHILGGFVSDCWEEQEGYSQRHSYYGSGLSFLFANHPLLTPGVDPEKDDDKELMLFKWTGSNDFCQICDKDQNKIAMGGASDFGIILEDDFYFGATGRCGTFANPPLTPDVDGTFTVASFEIYGLVPYTIGDEPSCQETNRAVDDPKYTAESLILHSESYDIYGGQLENHL